MEALHVIIAFTTLAAVVWPSLKRWIIGEEFAAHTHTERGQDRPLTTDGILYPRGTKKRATA